MDADVDVPRMKKNDTPLSILLHFMFRSCRDEGVTDGCAYLVGEKSALGANTGFPFVTLVYLVASCGSHT